MNIPVSIKQCRVILEIANSCSEVRASENLGLSQSSVSRTLKTAEDALDCTLFMRSWGGSDPTSEGELVIPHCRSILRLIRRAEKTIAGTAAPTPSLCRNVEWRHLRASHATALHHNVSSAAKDIRLSQPAVSRSLKELENMCRQPLFKRRKHGLDPLPTAQILAKLYEAATTEAQLIPLSLEALPDALSGRLFVGMSPFSCQEIVPKAFSEMARRFPHVRLQAMQAPYNWLVQMLQDGAIDCIVGQTRNLSPATGMKETPLADARYCLVARADDPSLRAAKSLNDLRDRHWVAAPHGTPVRRYFESLFDDLGHTPPSQTIEIITFRSAEQMIEHSGAIAVLPYDKACRSPANPNLAILKIRLPNPDCIIGITAIKARSLGPVAEYTKVIGELGKRYASERFRAQTSTWCL